MTTPPRWIARVSGVMLFLLLSCSCRAAAQTLDVKVGDARLADKWVPIATPPTFPALWALNAACLDRVYGPAGDGAGMPQPTGRAPLDAIKVFVAGDSVFINPDGRPVYGQFFRPDTIVLAGRYLFSARLVRHEMLHAQGVSGHTIVPFVSCGLWSGSLMEVFRP